MYQLLVEENTTLVNCVQSWQDTTIPTARHKMFSYISHQRSYSQCCCQGLETRGQGLAVQGRGQGQGVKLQGQGQGLGRH